MKRMTRRLIPALFVVLALVLGAWSLDPAQSFAAKTKTPKPTGTVGIPQTGLKAPLSDALPLIQSLSDFSVDLNAVSSSNVSDFDRAFVDQAWAMNQAGMMIMESTRASAGKNSELSNLILTMMTMHLKDQQTLESLRSQMGVTTAAPDLTAVQTLPGTSLADLGFASINLQNVYVDRVTKAKSGSRNQMFLEALMDLHAKGIESATVAEYTGENAQIKALAKHLADEESLHMVLMSALRDRLFLKSNTVITFAPSLNAGGGMIGQPGSQGGGSPTQSPSVEPTQVSTEVSSTTEPTMEPTLVPTLEPTLDSTLQPGVTVP